MDAIRVVFDCNTFLQALASPGGASGECFRLAAAGKIQLFVSPAVVAELQEVSARPKVVRQLKLTQTTIDEFIQTIHAIATSLAGFDERFRLSRDPDDSHYINLAMAAGARLIVTRDNDLLDLMLDSSDDARALRSTYPALQIVTPPRFLEVYRDESSA